MQCNNRISKKGLSNIFLAFEGVCFNPVIMVENICTLILAVHTILPHFKTNFPLRVIFSVVSPYT